MGGSCRSGRSLSHVFQLAVSDGDAVYYAALGRYVWDVPRLEPSLFCGWTVGRVLFGFGGALPKYFCSLYTVFSTRLFGGNAYSTCGRFFGEVISGTRAAWPDIRCGIASYGLGDLC